MIPRRESRDRVPDRFHHAGALMSEHCRQRRVVIAIPPVLVGLAHPARNDFHQQLVRTRLAKREPLDAEWPESFRATAAVICMQTLFREWIFQLAILVRGRMDDHLLVAGEILVEAAALYVLELDHDRSRIRPLAELVQPDLPDDGVERVSWMCSASLSSLTLPVALIACSRTCMAA